MRRRAENCEIAGDETRTRKIQLGKLAVRDRKCHRRWGLRFRALFRAAPGTPRAQPIHQRNGSGGWGEASSVRGANVGVDGHLPLLAGVRRACGLQNRCLNSVSDYAANISGDANPALTAFLTEISRKWPGIAAVIASWPNLPEVLRAGIVAMVDTSKPKR